MNEACLVATVSTAARCSPTQRVLFRDVVAPDYNIMVNGDVPVSLRGRTCRPDAEQSDQACDKVSRTPCMLGGLRDGD
jgi:hypothetical protein